MAELYNHEREREKEGFRDLSTRTGQRLNHSQGFCPSKGTELPSAAGGELCLECILVLNVVFLLLILLI